MKQTRITVSFRDKEEEQKLFKWIKDKGKVIGDANAIKQILYEQMRNDENK